MAWRGSAGRTPTPDALPDLWRERALTPLHQIVSAYGPVLGLVGVSATLAVNGRREERRRRRENHARALEAAVAYSEMPFRIRRRRHEEEHRSSERVRLSDAFSEVQAEIASCQALIRADPDAEVRDSYEQLIRTLRATAGNLASEAWSAPPITGNAQIMMPDIFKGLAPVRHQLEVCGDAMATSTRPWFGLTT